MHKTRSQFTTAPIVLVVVTVLAAGIGLIVVKKGKPNLDLLARGVISTCKNAPYRPSCYDDEIPKLMARISMEDAFAVTKSVQDKDPQYVYCHVLAHRLSFQESAKNPANWKDILPRCPMAMCNYGCLHGSLMQRFHAETLTDTQIQSIIADLQDVCEPRKNFSPTEIERSMCYHAMGHLTMFMTGANIAKAGSICETVSIKADGRNYLRTCLEGIFMTVFQSIDPEDKALVKDILPSKDHVRSFCDNYTGLVRMSCFRESYALFADEIRLPAGAVQFCSYAQTPEDIENCFGGVLNTLTTTWFTEGKGLPEVESYCKELPASRYEVCFATAAMRLLQIDPKRYLPTSVAICELSTRYGVSDSCFRDVIGYAGYSFPVGSDDFFSYCNGLPDAWRDQCKTSKGQTVQ